MKQLLHKIKKLPSIYQNEGIKGLQWRTSIRLWGDPYQRLYHREYQQWYKKNGIHTLDMKKLKALSRSLSKQPLISILTPVYNTDHQSLKDCINSVLSQAYGHWELILVNDNSTNSEIIPILNSFLAQDKRIKVLHRTKNGHICVASNDALKMARGEWVALLDHDDVLWPNALYEVAKRINDHPSVKFIYSDEDKIAEDNVTHCDPFFKPDWSPHFMWSCNYITHFSVIKTSLVKKVGGFRKGTQGAQDWDLFLRVIKALDGYSQHPWNSKCQIQHISQVLYSWRKSESSTASEKHAVKAKTYAYDVQVTVLDDAISNVGGGKVNLTKYIGLYETVPKLKNLSSVAVIIPTKDNLKFLEKCLRSLEQSTYQNFQIYIVDTGSSDKVKSQYEDLTRLPIKTLTWNKPFNFSAVCNFAADRSKEDYLVFLNDDTECMTPDWIERMLAYAQRDEVGAVGCRLLYPSMLIQFNGLILGNEKGVVLGQKGFVSNYFRLADPRRNYGVASLILENIRDYSAITGACMMISRKKHDLIHGFDDKFKIAFNDVDYSLKLNQQYLFNIVIPQVQFVHHESISLGRPSEGKRDLKLFAIEISMMRKKWNKMLDSDSFFNSNLALKSGLPLPNQE